MPEAYTFDEGNGSIKTFKTRRAMYDWMVENNHAVLEGSDAPMFSDHVARSTNVKAVQMAARLENESTHPEAVAIARAKVK